MPKQIETSFVISGGVSDEFISKMTTAAERTEQLNAQINDLKDLQKATQQFDIFEKKVLNTAQKMRELTEGTAAWTRANAAVERYIAQYSALADQLQAAGVDIRHLNYETLKLNETTQNAQILAKGMEQTIAAERIEVARLAQAYANASQQLARMNAQEQARVNGTYQAWQSSSPQNINIPGADNINYSASTVEGSLAAARIAQQQAEAARKNAEQSYNEYLAYQRSASSKYTDMYEQTFASKMSSSSASVHQSYNEYLAYQQQARNGMSGTGYSAYEQAFASKFAPQEAAAAEALKLQQEAIRKAQKQNRYNATSFLGGLGGFSFMGLGMSALGGAAPAYLAGAAVRGAFDLAKSSVTESMNFNQIVSELKAYTHATDAQTAALRDVAIQIGINSVFTAAEAARGMTYLGKAGWTTGQIQSGIGGVMNLAAASGEDLASVSSIVADTLGAFGMKAGEAQRFADVLAKTATRSNTDVGLMGETFKTSGPIAGALGYSIEDVSQMVGILANVGIKGSRAGTTMRNILNAFAKGFTISGANLGEYTFSAIDEYGKQKSLRKTIDDLRDAFSKLSNTEKVSNAQAIASMRGYAGLLALVNADAEAYERLAQEIANADGAAQEMADTRMDNLAGDVKYLTDAFQTLKIKIGDELTPTLRGFVQLATAGLRIINGEEADLGDEGKKMLSGWLKGSYTNVLKEAFSNPGIGISRGENGWSLSFDAYDKAQEYVEVIDEVVTANEELEESYEELVAAAKDSLGGQFALWEQAADVIPKDIYELMDAQESQAAYWKEYASNLDALYLRAGSIPGLAEFVDKNATGSADAVALMAGLVEATDAELTEFMRLYQENEYNRNTAAETQSVTMNFYINSEDDRGVAEEISLRVEDALRRIQEDRARVQIA